MRLVKNFLPTDWFNLSLATFGFFRAGEKIWLHIMWTFPVKPLRKSKKVFNIISALWFLRKNALWYILHAAFKLQFQIQGLKTTWEILRSEMNLEKIGELMCKLFFGAFHINLQILIFKVSFHVVLVCHGFS